MGSSVFVRHWPTSIRVPVHPFNLTAEHSTSQPPNMHFLIGACALAMGAAVPLPAPHSVYFKNTAEKNQVQPIYYSIPLDYQMGYYSPPLEYLRALVRRTISRSFRSRNLLQNWKNN